MPPFTRKRSIDIKKKDISIINDEISSNKVIERAFIKNKQKQKPFTVLIDRLIEVRSTLEKIPIEGLEKEVSNALGPILDLKKHVMNNIKLVGYRQCLTLMTKYQMQLKLQGKHINQQNSRICLALLKGILEETSSITKDEKYDEVVFESNLLEAIIQFMDVLVISVEATINLNNKKPILIRRSSLKKIEDLPELRPSSRNKLNNVSKKQKSMITQEKILLNKPKTPFQNYNTNFDIVVLFLCSIVKNLSANVKFRKQFLNESTLRLINRYLSIWNEKTISDNGSLILIQLTAFYRHLAVEQKSYKIFLSINCFDIWCWLIEQFPTSNDMIFNLLRIVSKLSNYESCCIKLSTHKQCLQKLSSFFKLYQNNIHIIIRIAFIFANMTSYLSNIRNELYFQFGVWNDIFTCFNHYATIQLSGKNQVDKMGLSMAAWDYQTIKKQSDIQAIIKIIRLIANIFTINEIGQNIYLNHSHDYKQLIKKLKNLLEQKNNIQQSSELISCILSCLTNVLYYDKQLLISNVEYKAVKKQLITILVDYVVQIDNEEICCQSLRVLSNLTRMKQYFSSIIQAKIPDAILILIGSTCKDIVYYSLGVLLNLITDDSFKQHYKNQLLDTIMEILNQCENDDMEIIAVGLKLLAAICNCRNQNIDPLILNQIENCLIRLGSNCDNIIMIDSNNQCVVNSIQQSRTLINSILNNMPEQKYICPIKNCGRKFPNDNKLQQHIKRRHKI